MATQTDDGRTDEGTDLPGDPTSEHSLPADGRHARCGQSPTPPHAESVRRRSRRTRRPVVAVVVAGAAAAAAGGGGGAAAGAAAAAAAAAGDGGGGGGGGGAAAAAAAAGGAAGAAAAVVVVVVVRARDHDHGRSEGLQASVLPKNYVGGTTLQSQKL
eukprot:COSAG02_NODE_2633_length_8375_cov_11.706501_5_plen_158_part_00